MTYLNAIKYINTAREGVNNDDTLVRLLALVGNPQKRIKYLRFAGSNGKTVCAQMLSSILERSTYRAGYLRMPVSEDMRQSIRIGNKTLEMSTFADCVDAIKHAVLEHNRASHTNLEGDVAQILPTRSEILLVVALMCFVRFRCDLAIIESDHCGDDPSRVLPPPFAAVICGTIPSSDTAQISRIRSYICKGIEEIVSAPQDSEAYKIISDTCYAVNCRLNLPNRAQLTVRKLTFGGCEFTYKEKQYSLGLCGRFQVYNAMLALEVIEMLLRRGFEISHEAVALGLSSVRMPAKVEVVSINPVMIIDSTHTPEAVKIVMDSIAEFSDAMAKRVRLCVPSGALANVYAECLKEHGFVLDSVITRLDERPDDESVRTEVCKTAKQMAKKCLDGLDKSETLILTGDYPFVSAVRYELLSMLGY